VTDDANAMAPTLPETAEEVGGPARQLGRFVIESMLGAGGMGIVFTAHDPVLDRRIAIKLIRGSSERAEARLLREAQGLARLKHPNVVTVHEAGTADGSVFIAMELVDGTNLREWLQQPRTWDEVVAVFVAAGRGLAAAHDAGLVHRDFKPANVFVDRTGAVKVGDFGLVGVSGDSTGPGRDEASSPPPPPDPSSTRTGEVMGTPAYMAPEQLHGEVVDSRADQYSFCKSLEEGLASRPHPAWLDQAVARGLAASPTARWPSMSALLDALEHTPRRRRRIVLAVGGALAIAGAATIGALATRGDAAVACDRAGVPATSVWSPAARDALVTGFAATGLGWAPDASMRAAARIDGWVGRWRDVRVEACRATHERGDQSATLLDRRVACRNGCVHSYASNSLPQGDLATSAIRRRPCVGHQ